jgi:hypothetical protein
MIWAGWKFTDGLRNKKNETNTTLSTALDKIEKARSAGDRWHAAYNFAHNLQKQQVTGEFSHTSENDRLELFQKMKALLEKFPSDTRLQRYLLLTLGQVAHPQSLSIFVKYLTHTDDELRFYGAWGLIQTLLQNKNISPAPYVEPILGWLKGKDVALKKIASAFLVQQNNPTWKNEVRKLLSNEEIEVRWNTAVVLASVGDASGKEVLKSVFDLNQIRLVQYRSAKDLEQLIATAYDAAKKLGDKDILQAANQLKEQLHGDSPESRAILSGLR